MIETTFSVSLKTILRVDRLASTDLIHELLNMGMLEHGRSKHVAVQMYSFTNNLAPTYCCNMFNTTGTYHSVNTRVAVNNGLVIPKMNLSIGQPNIRDFGVKTWHEIDHELKVIDTLEGLKEAIKKK